MEKYRNLKKMQNELIITQYIVAMANSDLSTGPLMEQLLFVLQGVEESCEFIQTHLFHHNGNCEFY